MAMANIKLTVNLSAEMVSLQTIAELADLSQPIDGATEQDRLALIHKEATELLWRAQFENNMRDKVRAVLQAMNKANEETQLTVRNLARTLANAEVIRASRI